MSEGSGSQAKSGLGMQLLMTYSYMFLWIFLSAAVIMVNKYVLSVSGFPYPVALTCTHMAFCSVMAFGLVKSGMVEAVNITVDTYLRCACASLQLTCGQTASTPKKQVATQADASPARLREIRHSTCRLDLNPLAIVP